MSIIGPPDREPDTLEGGYEWCACGLHQYPARLAFHVATVHTACPSCSPDSYLGKRAQKPVVHTVTWQTDDSQQIPREAS